MVKGCMYYNIVNLNSTREGKLANQMLTVGYFENADKVAKTLQYKYCNQAPIGISGIIITIITV